MRVGPGQGYTQHWASISDFDITAEFSTGKRVGAGTGCGTHPTGLILLVYLAYRTAADIDPLANN
jgi:hypothetical protein